jgi:hypothetical protein
MRTVGQEDLEQVSRAMSAIHPTRKSLMHQQRQVAAVIDMCMGQDDRVDISGRDGKRVPVAQSQLLEPLKKTTVDEEAASSALNQIFRPGDCTGTAQE